jgi:DNA helicase HerA-like ATPase
VFFLERVKIPWARGHRSAVELLGALERNRAEPQDQTVRRVPRQPSPASRRPEHLLLGTLASGDSLRIPVSDLLTHFFVCGGSGSGKTIACKHLIEELALAGVPSIVVDLKGDLSSLACIPSSTEVEAIAEYLLRLHGMLHHLRDEIAECARRASAALPRVGIR